MNCPNCGTENPVGTRFCTSCGTDLGMLRPNNDSQIFQTVMPEQPLPGANAQPYQQGMGVPPMPGANAQPYQQGMGVPPMNGQPMPSPYGVPPMGTAQSEKKGNAAVAVVIVVILVLIIVLVGVLLIPSISRSSMNKKINGYIESAEDYLDDNEYSEAVSAYQSALDLNEENEDAINGLTACYIAWAESLAAEGKYEDALDILKNADSRANRKDIKKEIEAIEEAMRVPITGWTDEDLNFYYNGGNICVALNHSFITRSSASYYTSYSDGDSVDYSDSFSTSRGLSLGMTLDDYVGLYDIKAGYAVWECYSGDNNEYTGFHSYDASETPAEVYDLDYNNIWLDIGFCKENGEWRELQDWEVRDTWFCDAYLDDYEEVVIFAVNFDYYGSVVGISLEHFSYDSGWVEWQDWAY